MKVSSEMVTLLRRSLAALNLAFEYDGNVFGIEHNNVVDLTQDLETAIAYQGSFR